VEPIKEKLEKKGYKVILPNLYEKRNNLVEAEKLAWQQGNEEHTKFKIGMYKLSREKIKNVDGILVLNFDKKERKNYIGGATFLEMYNAFLENKKIYLLNEIPNGDLQDEIAGFSPIILNGNLDLID
jgi:hypothetical protein